MDPTANPLAWLTRFDGHTAWIVAYAVTTLPFVAGLLKARAPAAKIAFFPILALPVTALAVLFVAMVQSSLANW